MGRPMTAAEQHTALSSTVHLLGISLPELWLEYFAMGGNLELFDLEAYIYGWEGVHARTGSVGAGPRDLQPRHRRLRNSLTRPPLPVLLIRPSARVGPCCYPSGRTELCS